MDLLKAIHWQDDRFTLAGYTFLLQHQRSENTAEDGFVLYKNRRQLEQYQRLFNESGFRPRTVLELGIWDGGSAAFWAETLGVTRYAAIDLQDRGDSNYFRKWSAERGNGRVSTHWGVSQDDPVALQAILADGLLPLDMVIDDASHMPGPSLRSFELLFPKLAPGGFYVLEDWSWALQPEFQPADHAWSTLPALHPIVHSLLDLHGSRPELISMLYVYPDAVIAQRGQAGCEVLNVERAIVRRHRPWRRIAALKVRHTLGNARRFVERRSGV